MIRKNKDAELVVNIEDVLKNTVTKIRGTSSVDMKKLLIEVEKDDFVMSLNKLVEVEADLKLELPNGFYCNIK